MRKTFCLLIFSIFFGGINNVFPQVLPIKVARTISFNTDEGSYMNLDISPDGRTLVFDLLGDLYTLPVSGGKATQITRGLALHVHPAWSPDGKMIAYLSDASGVGYVGIRDISRKHDFSIDGIDWENSSQIPCPLWADRDHVAVITSFTSMNIYDLNINNLKETTIKEVVALPDNAKILRISKDRQNVYFISASKSGDSLYHYNRRLKSPVSIGFIPLSEGPRAEVFTLSPDLHSLAYVADSAGQRCLFIRAIPDKGPATLLTRLNGKCPFMEYDQPHFCFSPDSKTIFISYGGKIHRIGLLGGEDNVIPFVAKVRSDFGAFNYHAFPVRHAPFKIKHTRSAVASPDGKRLVFSALNQLYIMDLPYGKPHCLCPQPVNQYQPCWSPDGKWIAYVSWCDTAGGHLWKVPAKGGRPIQLTTKAGQYQRPCWSPDGKQVAVIKGGVGWDYALYAKGEGTPGLGQWDYPGSGQLRMVAVQSGSVKAVADSVPLLNQVSFSKDGQRIVYAPTLLWQGSKTPILVSRDINDKGLQVLATVNHTTSEVPLSKLLQRSLSPDNRYLVYSRAEDLYLEPVKRLPVMVGDPDQQLTIIRFAMGVDPHWEQGGKVLSWSYGNEFYRIDPDKVMTAARYGKVQKAIGIKDNDIIAVKIRPDQMIPLNLKAPVFYAHGTIALKNARIITMQGNKVIEKGTILIRNGRFAAVENSSVLTIPKGAKVYDLAGKTIMPGLVDLHLHLLLSQEDVFPQQGWQYLVNLAYGVTTARDPSATYDSFAYTELLQYGRMIGPRLFSSGRAVSLQTFSGVRIDNLADAQRTVTKRKLMGGTFMKQYLLPTRLQREWLLLASKAQGLNMTNEGEFDPILALGQLKDGSSGVEHNPNWGEARKDVITLFAKSGTWLTPTLQVRPAPGGLDYFDSKYWRHPDEKMARFMPDIELHRIVSKYYGSDDSVMLLHAAEVDAAIRQAGGGVTMGSHGNNEGIGPHNELWALQMGGLSNMQALQAATIMGAEALGIQKDVGSIEPGKIADLIILNKNPLEDIHNSREIKYVMKDGVLYDGDTLDELWPMYKKCPEWRLHGNKEWDNTSVQEPKKAGKTADENSDDDGD